MPYIVCAVRCGRNPKNSFVEMWTVFLCKKYIFSKWHIFI
jgi:hypothetical protein